MDGTTVDMPFWGNYGSVNERDSLTLKLSSKQTVDMATLYFYNDRQTNGYSEPSKFAVEYWDGEAWQAVRQQTRTPSAPRANYNAVYFAPVETDHDRFTFTTRNKGFTAVSEWFQLTILRAATAIIPRRTRLRPSSSRKTPP